MGEEVEKDAIPYGENVFVGIAEAPTYIEPEKPVRRWLEFLHSKRRYI